MNDQFNGIGIAGCPFVELDRNIGLAKGFAIRRGLDRHQLVSGQIGRSVQAGRQVKSCQYQRLANRQIVDKTGNRTPDPFTDTGFITGQWNDRDTNVNGFPDRT